MFISTIIPTIGRESLHRAVHSVLAQVCDDEFEVIVVNDCGHRLAPADWQSSPKIKIIETQRHERCVARNTGAAVATGRYLHFLDDDDWLLPGAFQALKRLADETSGAWLYGGSQLVDRHGNPLIQLHHNLTGNCALQVMAGEWIPLPSSLFDARLFFSLGGFNPLIPGAEDIDLTRRVALETDIAGTMALVACIGMGREGSSTDYDWSKEALKAPRESLLDQRNTYARLRAGATSAYWWGRLLRIYATSALWNWQQRRIMAGFSRFLGALATLLYAGRQILSQDFRTAFTGPYRNETFRRGFIEAGLTPS